MFSYRYSGPSFHALELIDLIKCFMFVEKQDRWIWATLTILAGWNLFQKIWQVINSRFGGDCIGDDGVRDDVGDDIGGHCIGDDGVRDDVGDDIGGDSIGDDRASVVNQMMQM